MFYGGLAGALSGKYAYCKIYQLDFGTAMKLIVPVLPLGHAFMRMGCFLAGCCYGIEHPWGITFTAALGAPSGVPLLPVQLYETVLNLVIFAVLWTYTKTERSPLLTGALYALMYSTARFFLEFLRGDTIRGIFWGLPTSQFISIIVFAAAAGFLANYKLRRVFSKQ